MSRRAPDSGAGADPPPTDEATRGQRSRRMLLATGAATTLSAVLAALAAGTRFLFPSVLYEPPRRFRVGRPEDFPPGTGVLLAEHRLFVFNDPTGFRAVSAVCSHLGCNVRHERSRGFACPCHGSVFDLDGRVAAGPARRPLDCYALSLSRRGELVVDTRKVVRPGERFQA